MGCSISTCSTGEDANQIDKGETVNGGFFNGGTLFEFHDHYWGTGVHPLTGPVVVAITVVVLFTIFMVFALTCLACCGCFRFGGIRACCGKRRSKRRSDSNVEAAKSSESNSDATIKYLKKENEALNEALKSLQDTINEIKEEARKVAALKGAGSAEEIFKL